MPTKFIRIFEFLLELYKKVILLFFSSQHPQEFETYLADWNKMRDERETMKEDAGGEPEPEEFRGTTKPKKKPITPKKDEEIEEEKIEDDDIEPAEIEAEAFEAEEIEAEEPDLNEAFILEGEITIAEQEQDFKTPVKVWTPKLTAKWIPTSDMQIEADAVWAHWLAVTGIPFSVSDLQVTHDMLDYFKKRMILKSSITYAVPKVEIVARNISDEVRKCVEEACEMSTNLGLSVEVIPTKREVSYLAVDLHYVDEEFQYHHVILSVNELPPNPPYDKIREIFDVSLMAYPSILGKSKVIVSLDQTVHVLSRAINSSFFVSSTVNCSVKKLEYAIRKAFERTPEAMEVMMLCISMNEVLNNNKDIRGKMEELCNTFEGKKKWVQIDMRE